MRADVRDVRRRKSFRASTRTPPQRGLGLRQSREIDCRALSARPPRLRNRVCQPSLVALPRQKSVLCWRMRSIRALERSAATAAARCVRIFDAKPGSRQIIAIINCRSGKERCALGMDHPPNPTCFKNLIIVTRLIKRHAVLHSRASAALDKNTQAFAGFLRWAGQRLKLTD